MNQKEPVFHLGLELTGGSIRAGVFDSDWRLVGKAGFSAKHERGPAVVCQRIARCAMDAVDEADLLPQAIQAIGLLAGLDGRPVDHSGRTGVELQQGGLMTGLAAQWPWPSGRRLVVGELHAGLLWAVHEHELAGIPQSMLGVFAGSDTKLFYADRRTPGDARQVPSELLRTATVWQAPPVPSGPGIEFRELVAALQQTKPEVMLLIGKPFEDGESSAVQEIRAMLDRVGLTLPIHIPLASRQVGVWAAARLAARTFAQTF